MTHLLIIYLQPEKVPLLGGASLYREFPPRSSWGLTEYTLEGHCVTHTIFKLKTKGKIIYFNFCFQGYLTKYAIDSPEYLGWRRLQAELKKSNPKMNYGFKFRFAQVNCPINLASSLIKFSITRTTQEFH